MKTKDLVFMALLVGLGAILHLTVPGIYLGMKPDFSLIMLFIGILLFPEKKHVLLLSLATGIISGMTTNFPNGFFPNFFEKPITGFIYFGLFLLLKKKRTPLVNGILTAAGTIVSGFVFLSLALLLVGLPGPFAALFTSVVLPTAAFNTAAVLIIEPLVRTVGKRSNLITIAD
jgi:hypothetical protein